MVIHKCDRCGKDIENPAGAYKITYWTFTSFPDESMELCKDCHDELLEWLGVEEKEPAEIKAYKLDEPDPNLKEMEDSDDNS